MNELQRGREEKREAGEREKWEDKEKDEREPVMVGRDKRKAIENEEGV